MTLTASNSFKNEGADIYAFAEALFPCTDIRTYVSPLQHREAVKRNWRPEIPSEAYIDTLTLPLIDIVLKFWHEEPCQRLEASKVNVIANNLFE